MKTLQRANTLFTAAWFACAVLATQAIAGDELPGQWTELIAIEGEMPTGGGGGTILTLGSPFTNSNGEVGFTGSIDIGGTTEHFVWFGTGITFLDTEALPTVLSGAESTMGISDAGAFIYSPSTDGDDSVWSSDMLRLQVDDPAPLFPGRFISFASRPQMDDDGEAYFVAGITDVAGGSTQDRILYRASGVIISKVLASGDLIGGIPISGSNGIDFDYDVSSDGDHYISVVDLDTGSIANDLAVVVDGVAVVQEDDPIDGVENWDNFDVVGINSNGDYIYTGDTNGDTSTDEFLAINGEIVVREGDTLAGVTLTSAAQLRAASINDAGQVVCSWGIAGGTELLFVGDAADFAYSARLLLATGDELDFDGDGTVDAVVTDFNASTGTGPGIDHSAIPFVYLEVDLLPTGEVEELEAIIKIAVPPVCSAGNVNPAVVGRSETLTVNGTDGGGDAAVEVESASPITIGLTTSAAGPESARYVVWGWFADGENPTVLSKGGSDIGCLVNPTPVNLGLSPQPDLCIVGSGIPALACRGGVNEISGLPGQAPWVANRPQGLVGPVTLTLQGLIEDNAATHPQGFSVTNAVTIRVQ